MEGEIIYTFEQEGVTVILPAEAENILVQRVEPVFKLSRLVIQIDFFDRSKPEQPLVSWEHKAQLRVRYTPEDVFHAGCELQNLKLGYFWDNRWWVFTPEKHGFRLIPDDEAHPSRGGVGIAFLNTWNDPPIGWGS